MNGRVSATKSDGLVTKRMLIVKLGSTFPSLVRETGDFDVWITDRLGVDPTLVAVVDPIVGETLPDPRQYSGIVLTGSHDMVTTRLPWSERTAAWIPAVLRNNVPMLGICYGHQLIAHAMGGIVGDNPQGSEYGTVRVHLSAYGRRDVLFHGFPPEIRTHVSHVQSVLKLPRRARRIASSANEKHQAYFLPPSAWGVQFHPEFNESVISRYVGEFADVLRSEGKAPHRMHREITGTPMSEEILRRFAGMALNGLERHRRMLIDPVAGGRHVE